MRLCGPRLSPGRTKPCLSWTVQRMCTARRHGTTLHWTLLRLGVYKLILHRILGMARGGVSELGRTILSLHGSHMGRTLP